MTDFKKTIATAKAKVADAETRAFMARLEAIDAILEGATPDDVVALCAHALAAVAPLCCEAHQDEFKADLLEAIGECVEIIQEEQDAAEADTDDDAHTSVH
jgi:hypothetical protein